LRAKEFQHKPVLIDEAVAKLEDAVSKKPKTDSQKIIAVDCTFGRGGHTKAFLEVLENQSRDFHLIALDQDKDAVTSDSAKELQSQYEDSFSLHHCKFSQLKIVLQSYGLDQKVDYLFADIGVSSPQLDTPERGFGFESVALDMRMDQNTDLTAAKILNNHSPEELTKIFFEYGEEPKARVFARKICEAREKTPFTSPAQLADIAKSVWSRSKSRVHPGTRVFQALRIAVNDELGELDALLEGAPNLLSLGGVMGVISFHSLEDKRVKKCFKKLSGSRSLAEEHLFAQLPVSHKSSQLDDDCGFEIIKPFPQKPGDVELSTNPRSRSAKLRWIQRKL
jgi:16S rRNA (cytosine1402-N4)-methyltransferase